MNRKTQRFCVWLLLCVVVCTGCTPVQPFYLNDTGQDLSTYLDSATEIAYADVEHQTLEDVTRTYRPRTVAHPEFDSIWDLTLEEAVATTLQNSKVIRTFTGNPSLGQFVNSPPVQLTRFRGNAAATIYDVAIQETGQSGVAQALSQFDAVFNSNATWDRRDRIQNLTGFGRVDQNDRVLINNEVVKRAATGSQFTFRNQSIYENDADPNNQRAQPSNWFTAIEAEVRQPLLRGAGTQVNRIPIVVARIRTDQVIADFEFMVREMMQNVETAYWDLYFFYRNLNAAKLGRDSALSTWKRIYALSVEKAEGGEAQQEAQAREQYFFFRSRVEEALRDLYKSETRLRYLMGLGATDGRLIRPADHPTRARVAFDWHQIHSEALVRSVELRRQHWQIKSRELELIQARNQLLPQLDVVGLYRWLGQGDGFNSLSNTNPPAFPADGSQAVDGLLNGNFQDGQLGFQLSVPIGFRRELSQVRNGQLALARERAILQEMEMEISHQLTDAIMDLESQQMIAQTHYNRVIAAEAEVKAMEAAFETGTVTLNRLLDAQRRRADAEIAFYQSVAEYQLSIVRVHFRKGSLLDYNGVVLAEGPWPAKAYVDAHERARRRAASTPLDYGYSRPRVVSKGAVPQTPGSVEGVVDQSLDLTPTAEVIEGDAIPGEIFEPQRDATLEDESAPDGELPMRSPGDPPPRVSPATPEPGIPETTIPEPAPIPSAEPDAVETKLMPPRSVQRPASQTFLLSAEAATSGKAVTSKKKATPKRRSKVAQVSFVDDAAQPAAKSSVIKVRPTQSDESPDDAPLPQEQFGIRDPAKGQTPVKINWK